VSDQANKIDPLRLIAAMVDGDRCVDADGAAVLLGLWSRNGEPNVRKVTDELAHRPDFPKRNPVTRTWRKSELLEWDAEQRRANRAA